MNTKLLMSVSAVLLGATGIVLTFMPAEVSLFLNFPGTNSIIFQVLGALYFGFAMLNWTAKGNVMGGIYSRPVAIGNFSHFIIGGLALIKLAIHNPAWSAGWVCAIVYLIFAFFFGWVFFNNPIVANKSM